MSEQPVSRTESRARRLHHVFERQADLQPDACAVESESGNLTYAELDAHANRIANHLARRGVRVGARVGLMLDRSPLAYAALLGVLKAGAAFVPLDPACPAERAAFVASDARLDLLVTVRSLTAVLGDPCPLLALDGESDAIAGAPATRPNLDSAEDPLCYVIYTSGTTGRPKGVAIAHSTICNLLDVSVPIYGVRRDDRVFQGITFAFDFSIEEVWHTFAVGATLIPGPTDDRKLGPALLAFLRERRISAFLCTPTLLSTLPVEPLPHLRTLIVGGETCPAELVKRWATPGRRMLNTYGPTETTVTATWVEVQSDRPVTIGRPFPTYTVHIVDDLLQPVPVGEVGEICIGGPNVGLGYINRDDLTAARFVPDPFSTQPGARLYRTGDRGRELENGEIAFLGRIDGQIKIRGQFAELGEIEAVLLESPEVSTAAVAPLSADGAIHALAAYITLRDPATDFASLRERLYDNLRRKLPSYMVPAYLETIDVLPQLPSGKVDRARLPAPRRPATATEGAPPTTDLEKRIASAWAAEFRLEQVSIDANFFTDLGGHSLAAARVVSILRAQPDLRGLGIGQLYARPTVRGLAALIEETSREAPDVPAAEAAPRLRHSEGRIAVCGAAQLVLVYLLFAVFSLPLALFVLAAPTFAFGTLAVGVLIVSLAPLPLAIGVSVLLKWLLIGRFRPGRYPLWGWYYCRWWLVRQAMSLPLAALAGTPFLALYVRLLGARIGRGCHLGSPSLLVPDLIEIGAGAHIGPGVELRPYAVAGGFLHLAPVRIGAGAFVGTNSVILPGGTVGHEVCLVEGTLVAGGQTIPDGETRAGSPAARIAADPALTEMADQAAPERWSMSLLVGFFCLIVLLQVLPVLVALPAVWILFACSGGEVWRGLACTPLAALIFVPSVCVTVVLLRGLVRPPARPGLFPLRSLHGLRHWLADRLMSLSLGLTNTLFGTLYVLPFLRLLGARIGRRSELTTVAHLEPELLELGTESFVADLSVIGAPRYHRGWVRVGRTRIGSRSFAGNSSLVVAGTDFPDGSLIGVLSVAPTQPVEAGTSWLGSPAIFLPRRQSSGNFDESVTFRPSAVLVACRLVIEYFRVTLPATIGFFLLALGAAAVLWLERFESVPVLVLALPALYFGLAFLGTLLVAALKWVIIGRYRARVEPLWSHFVWRTEVITGLYEMVVGPFLQTLRGTPFLPPLLRLLGARIGRRVWMDSIFLTEFDLVSVGADSEVGDATALQTHLFEDRVMKMSTVTVGADCTVGARSVILYDAALENGASLDALSLVMKGETLPESSTWRGIPARRAD